MQRVRTITYQSCDLCDSLDEAIGKCEICNKYLCKEHYHRRAWGDQEYSFCFEHLKLVSSIIKQTGIPIGFVVYKLTPQVPLTYLEDMFKEQGYDKLWREGWEVIEYPCCICSAYTNGSCHLEERQRKSKAIHIVVPPGCPKSKPIE